MSTTTKNAESQQNFVPAAALLGGLLLLLFLPTLIRLGHQWWLDPSYSHGFLILPLSLGVAWWIYKHRAGTPKEGAVVLGSVVLVIGCVIHLAGLLIQWPLIEFVAMVFVLRGMVLTAGGAQWARHFLFPTLFLFFMFPLPVAWTSALAIWLQNVVASISAGILELFFVCYRRGNALYLAGAEGPIYVAYQCSGLRQMIAFLALGCFLSFIFNQTFKPPWWQRALFVLSAIPVAILANIARVLLMAIGIRYFGTDWASGWMHHIPALVTLPLGLALFLLVGWCLWRLSPRLGDKQTVDSKENEENRVPEKALADCR